MSVQPAPQLPPPTGIVVTFIGGFLAIVASFVLCTLKCSLGISFGGGRPDVWVLFLVLVLVARHQLRVVFIDSAFSFRMRAGWRRWAMRLLVLLAAMGGMSFWVFGVSSTAGALFMHLYSAAFTVFGLVVVLGRLAGTGSSEVQAWANRLLFVVSDIITLFFWLMYRLYVASGNHASYLNALMIVLIVMVFALAQEYRSIYHMPLYERMRDFVRLIR